MRALSLWQPWASLVALDLKGIETRSWGTRYRGDVAIHAAKHWTKKERVFSEALAEWEHFAALRDEDPGKVRGVVVCVVRLAGCVEMTKRWIDQQSMWEKQVGGYAPGRYGWMLEDVRLCRVELKGKQGLWKLGKDEERAVLAALGGQVSTDRQGSLFG